MLFCESIVMIVHMDVGVKGNCLQYFFHVIK